MVRGILGKSARGGADLGEVLSVCASVTPGDAMGCGLGRAARSSDLGVPRPPLRGHGLFGRTGGGQPAELGSLVPASTVARFTQEEGASYHGQPLARELTGQRMFDWLDEHTSK